MRLRCSNEWKGRRFDAALAMLVGWVGVAASGAVAQEPLPVARVEPTARGVTLQGEVLGADGVPAAAVEVAFHYRVAAGLPWLRAANEDVEAVCGRTDGRGHFELRAPLGVAGSLVAWRGGERALAAATGGGERVRLRLARVAARTFAITGVEDDTPLQVAYEGRTPLAPTLTKVAAGKILVAGWPMLGAVVSLPEDRLTRSSRLPWFGASGADRQRIRTLDAETLAVDFAWAAPLDALDCVRRHGHRLPDGQACVWRGQLADGVPFVARGQEVARAAARWPRRLVMAGLHAVVVATNVEVTLADDTLVFTLAEALRRDGDAWVVSSFVPPTSGLWLGRDDEGWRVLGEGGACTEAAHTVTVVVRGDDDRTPVAGATLRIRPRSCQPRETWHGFAGLEVVAGSNGRVVVPARLPDGDYDWIVMAADGRTVFGVVKVAGGDVEVAAALPEGGLVRGLVVDADGEPIAGLAVELHAGLGEVPASFGWPEHRTHTDTDGEFCLRGLRQDQAYELVASSPAWGEVVADGVRAGDTKLGLQLRPPAAPR